ncbi:hypothetical protein J6590_001699 [Homalodisca vitripennis]|nr:hypothetical protein J6590_001699 [Homalodisca vitripennis]
MDKEETNAPFDSDTTTAEISGLFGLSAPSRALSTAFLPAWDYLTEFISLGTGREGGDVQLWMLTSGTSYITHYYNSAVRTSKGLVEVLNDLTV